MTTATATMAMTAMTMTTACAPALSALPDWCDLVTRAGRFTLAPVRPDRDLWRLHRWFNDPAVNEYWQLAGDLARVDAYLAEQRSLPYKRGYVGRLSGRAIGYWEIYLAAEDRIGRCYPSQSSDLGVQLLIGEPDCRGIGLGPVLLEALAESLQRGTDRRVVAEPDERNLPSVRAFSRAGFHRAGTIALPEKNAALMVREASPVTERTDLVATEGPAISAGSAHSAHSARSVCSTPSTNDSCAQTDTESTESAASTGMSPGQSVGVPPRPRRTAEGLMHRGD